VLGGLQCSDTLPCAHRQVVQGRHADLLQPAKVPDAAPGAVAVPAPAVGYGLLGALLGFCSRAASRQCGACKRLHGLLRALQISPCICETNPARMPVAKTNAVNHNHIARSLQLVTPAAVPQGYFTNCFCTPVRICVSGPTRHMIGSFNHDSTEHFCLLPRPGALQICHAAASAAKSAVLRSADILPRASHRHLLQRLPRQQFLFLCALLHPLHRHDPGLLFSFMRLQLQPCTWRSITGFLLDRFAAASSSPNSSSHVGRHS